MSVKTWKINNGLNCINDCGQSILVEIGPSDFDPFYNDDDEIPFDEIPFEYYRGTDGTRWVFRQKAAWLEAIATLRAKGFSI